MQCTDEGDTNTLWGSDGSAIVWLNDGLGTDVFPTFDIFSTSETKEGVQVAPAGPVRNGEGNAVEGRLSSRERQKRYRERQKLKLNTIRNQFNEVSAEYEAVLTENIELKQSNSALEALAAYGSAMLNMIASSALHSYHEFRNLSAVSLEYLKGLHGAIVDKVLQSRLSCQDLISVWDSLTIAGHRRYVLSLWLIHIANILKEWKDHPDRRSNIENVLGKHRDLFLLVGKTARKWMSWFYTGIFSEVKEVAILIENEYGATLRDPELVNAVRLSNKQYEALKDAWYEYVAKYAELKSRLVTKLLIAGAQADMSSFKNFQVSSQQLAKQNLSIHRALEAFKELEKEEIDIRMNLMHQSVTLLSPLQAAYVRLLNISSSDVRAAYGVLLELDWDNNEALMDTKRPSTFVVECLKAIV